MEAGVARCGNRLAGLLRTFFDLRFCEPPEFSVHRFRQSDHSRRRTFFLQLVWANHHDPGRHARRIAGSAALRLVFLLAARGDRYGVLQFLVLRELSVYRHVHGGRTRPGSAVGWRWRTRLGNVVRPMGPFDAGPEYRCGHARPWVVRDACDDGLAGVAHVAGQPSATALFARALLSRAWPGQFRGPARFYGPACQPYRTLLDYPVDYLGNLAWNWPKSGTKFAHRGWSRT